VKIQRSRVLFSKLKNAVDLCSGITYWEMGECSQRGARDETQEVSILSFLIEDSKRKNIKAYM
jgi:hypothetical protein